MGLKFLLEAAAGRLGNNVVATVQPWDFRFSEHMECKAARGCAATRGALLTVAKAAHGHGVAHRAMWKATKCVAEALGCIHQV